MAFIAKLN